MQFSNKINSLSSSPINWLIQYALENPNVISFAAGLVDDENLPLDDIRLALQDISAKNLQYGVCSGELELKNQILAMHSEFTNSNSDNVVITTGGQQYLFLLAEAFAGSGKIILIEAPTYFVYRDTLASFDVTFKIIPTDEEGICPASLEKILFDLNENNELDQVAFLYTITYGHNPTGITTPFSRKEKIAEVLKIYQSILLIEDAAYRDLNFSPAPNSYRSIPEIKDRSVYVSTFSKPYCPGLKTGYGIASKKISQILTRLKGNHDFGSSRLNQALLIRIIELGLYDKQRDNLVNLYKRKAKALEYIWNKELGAKFSLRFPDGGLYFWVSLPFDTGRDSIFFKNCLDENVLIVPGEYCSFDDDPESKKAIRLTYGNVKEKEIEEGIFRLSKAIFKTLS